MSGASGTVEVVVVRGKKPVAQQTTKFVDGQAVVTSGGAGEGGGAAVTLTLTEKDAAAVRDGRLDLSVAFMRGQMKMSGDFGLLLRLLPLVSTRNARIDPASLVPALLV